MVMVNVDKLERSATADAARVASRAFLTNPTSVAAFKGETEALRKRQEAMYKTILDHFPGELLAARWGKPLVGVLGMTRWPDCEIGLVRGLIMLPRLLLAMRELTPRLAAWRSAWADHHPKEPHWHLGPVAVLPRLQGQGVGSRMVQRFCDRVDQRRVPGYLETDKPENVTLYERFGFEVREEAEVFGVPSWFMWREPEPEFLKRQAQQNSERSS